MVDKNKDWKELQKNPLFSELEVKVIDMAKTFYRQGWTWDHIRQLLEFMADEARYKAEIEIADTVDFEEK